MILLIISDGRVVKGFCHNAIAWEVVSNGWSVCSDDMVHMAIGGDVVVNKVSESLS